MGYHLKRNFIIFATLLIIMQITKGQDVPPPAESEEDDSSSEETVEDSNESPKLTRRRRRRSFEMSDESAVATKANDGKSQRAIPGLPDPATILKIAEILMTVGEQVIPILVSGNSGATEFVANRVSRDMKFLKNFKNEIDVLTENLKMKK